MRGWWWAWGSRHVGARRVGVRARMLLGAQAHGTGNTELCNLWGRHGAGLAPRRSGKRLAPPAR